MVPAGNAGPFAVPVPKSSENIGLPELPAQKPNCAKSDWLQLHAIIKTIALKILISKAKYIILGFIAALFLHCLLIKRTIVRSIGFPVSGITPIFAAIE